MRVFGGDEDLALCGPGGAPHDGGGLVIALGGAAGADVRFAFCGDDAGDGGRVVAPAGEALWRRAPWPARDALFDLAPAADARAVLVAGAPGADRDEVTNHLRANGIPTESRDRVTLDALRTAAIVVLLGGHGALPAYAPAVLAARRVLVTDATETTFGLQPGIEFLRADHPGEAAERANMAALHPRAVVTLRVMGARAARDHRASIVYPRLAADLA
jgi:hypothetical protein